MKGRGFLPVEHCPWTSHSCWWPYPYGCLALQPNQEPQTYNNRRAGGNLICFSEVGGLHQRQIPEVRE